jgi:probable phosphoglycerate mutase
LPDTLILLVRHAVTDQVGRVIAGRIDTHGLNSEGRTQAAQLARNLSGAPLAAVYSSPIARARETAAAIASARGLDVQICQELTEVDVGAWSGRTLDELATIAEWHSFNDQRGATKPPGGERMQDVQARVVEALDRIANQHVGEIAVAVSHADAIRAALLSYLRMPIDDYWRLEIDPASVTVVALQPATAARAERTRVIRLNVLLGRDVGWLWSG